MQGHVIVSKYGKQPIGFVTIVVSRPKNRVQYKPTNHPATFHFTTAQTLAKNLQGRYSSCISLAVEEVPTPLTLDADLCRKPAKYRWAVSSFRSLLLCCCPSLSRIRKHSFVAVGCFYVKCLCVSFVEVMVVPKWMDE